MVPNCICIADYLLQIIDKEYYLKTSKQHR